MAGFDDKKELLKLKRKLNFTVSSTSVDCFYLTAITSPPVSTLAFILINHVETSPVIQTRGTMAFIDFNLTECT